ncbi:hypothetical protein [Rhizobium sp. No.120]
MRINLSRLAGVMALGLNLILVNACADFESGALKVGRVKTVGVISAIGDRFSFSRAGMDGFDEANRQFPIESWGLDAMIEAEATTAIGADLNVQPLSYDQAAFYAPGEKKSTLTPLNLMREDRLKQLLRSVTPQSLDAYIVIAKARSNIGPSGRTVEGIGALTYRTLLGSRNIVYALYDVRVYDGHTFKLLEERQAAPLDHRDLQRLSGPTRFVTDAFMPNAGDPSQNNDLKNLVTDLIQRSLLQTLRDLRLAHTARQNQ